MAQSVHNLAGGLKTSDARAIEKSTVAILEVELKNGSKTLYAAGSSGWFNPRQRALLEKLGVPKENILSGKKIYVIERCCEEYQSCGTNYLEKYTRWYKSYSKRNFLGQQTKKCTLFKM